MLLKKILLSFLIISIIVTGNLSLADDSTYLDQNQKAPFAGFLLPEATVQTLRNNTLERNAFEKLNDSNKITIDLQQKNLDLKSQEVNILLDQNLKLIKSATEDHSLNNFEKVAYFIGGFLVTGLAVWGAHELNH